MAEYDYYYDYEEPFLSHPAAILPGEEGVFGQHFIDTTLQMVLGSCIQPSIISVARNIGDLLMYNLLFNIFTQTGHNKKTFNHIMSFMLGTILLGSMNCPIKFCIFISFVFTSYAVLYTCHKLCKGQDFSGTTFSMAVLMLSLIFCEFHFPFAQQWLEIRGVIMILVMKALSLSHDYDRHRYLPSLLEYLGYVCCPANCIFGPWISFAEYCSIFRRPNKKNVWWILRILTTLTIALFFLTVSNCWADYFLLGGNKLVQAFRMALTFRTSHYFISYLSEMGMVVAGYKDDKCPHNSWRYKVVHPLKVEFSSSLVSVVTNWNIPMHMFLKKYIYRKILPLGQFCAILGTFFVSALLHGFNVEIAVVLLSIGLFSYIQLRVRNKLSEDLNACVQIRACKKCNHRYKRGSSLVTILSMIFGVFTILHLAYLGQLMDAIDNPNTSSILKKWENVHFCSHLIMFFAYLYCLS